MKKRHLVIPGYQNSCCYHSQVMHDPLFQWAWILMCQNLPNISSDSFDFFDIFASTVTISQGFGQAAKVDQFATYEKELNVVACHGFPNHQYDQDRWIAGIHLASLGFPTFESARFDVNENVISQPAVALALHSEWILNSPNVSQSLQPASCQWEDFHRACHSWLSLFIHPCWDFSMLLFPWHQCKS